MAGERAEILGCADSPVLRPLDLRREVGCEAEPVGLRQAVGDLPEQQHLRGEQPVRRGGGQAAQLRERGGVEGAGVDPRDAEALEAAAQLSRRAVGEGHREDRLGGERAGRHLVGDPARDRRRLPGAGAREDADRPARRLHRAPLLRVQPVEDRRRGHRDHATDRGGGALPRS